MINKVTFFAAWIFLCIIASACSSGGGNNPPPSDNPIDDPGFTADIQTIFSASCALSNCHNANAQGGMVLLAGQAYGQIVNVASFSEPAFKRVLPGNANDSYIVIKLEGRQAIGAQMPLGGTLSATRIQNIKNWINKGAKNN